MARDFARRIRFWARSWAPRLLGGLGLGFALLALAPHGPAAADPKLAYPLDAFEREVLPDGPLPCPFVKLVDYRGDVIKYSSSTKVFAGFRDRLKEFEKVARDVGIEVYGRPPQRIVHVGTYSCRRVTSHANLISEHALGNAIDIAGFNFGPLPKGKSLPAGLSKDFKNGFEVRVLSHWKAKTGHAAVHARFLKTLAERLVARKNIFRVLLGPGYPGHDNHFHFDVAPYRMVEIHADGHPITAP